MNTKSIEKLNEINNITWIRIMSGKWRVIQCVQDILQFIGANDPTYLVELTRNTMINRDRPVWEQIELFKSYMIDKLKERCDGYINVT